MKTELSRLSLFNHHLAGLCYRPVAGLDQGPSTQNLLWNITTTLVLKFSLVNCE